MAAAAAAGRVADTSGAGGEEETNPRRGGGRCLCLGTAKRGEGRREGKWLGLDEGTYRCLKWRAVEMMMMGREIRPLTVRGPRGERADGAGPRGRGAVHRRVWSGLVCSALAVAESGSCSLY